MVSPITGVLFFGLGITTMVVGAALGPSLPMWLRMKQGRHHYSNSMRAFGQAAIVWRSLGGPELKPVSVNDKASVAQVVLSSGRLSDDEKLPFRDPDNRLKRLHKKPLAVISEVFPAATDAELSELGHWVDQKGSTDGFGGDGEFDPYLPVGGGLRAASPIDTLYMLVKSVEPEYVETTKQVTKARMEKYNEGIGAKETLATIFAYAVGAGVVGTIYYVKNEIMGGGGGGGSTSVPVPGGVGVIAPDAMQLLGGMPL